MSDDRTPLAFPDLRDDQHAVLGAEVQTGVVLSIEGARWRKDEPRECWRVFDSFEAAHRFAKAEVAKRPSAEFTIFDRERQPLEIVRDEAFWDRPVVRRSEGLLRRLRRLIGR